MPSTKQVLKYLKLNEERISLALGVLLILVVGLVVFNSFRNKDNKPQISQEAAQTQTPQEGQVPHGLGGTHKVVAGDTLWSIAEKHYSSGYNWIDLAEANKLSSPGMIKVGQELTLPHVAAKASTIAQAAPEEAPAAPAPTTPQAVATSTPQAEVPQIEAPQAIGSDTYTVVAGDHLWGIAVRAYGDGYQWVKVWQANKALIGNHPNLIYVGQSLVIPRDTTK